MMTAMVKTSVNFVSRCLTKLNKNALIKIVYTISVVACFGRDAYSSSNIMTQKIMKYKTNNCISVIATLPMTACASVFELFFGRLAQCSNITT